jgi:hypothetical protein
MAITHVNGTEAVLRHTYGAIPRFPTTPKGYDGVSPVEAAGQLFDPDPDIISLPIVAFPGLTVSTASAASAGGLIPWLRGVFGFSRSASESVQMRIPQAETYGIYAAAAEGLLEDFCAPDGVPAPTEICTDSGIRRRLSSRNPGVLRKRPGHPLNHVSIQFIYRVYMTRSVDYVYGADTSVGAAAHSGGKPASGGPAGTEPAGPTPDATNQNDALGDLRRRLGDAGRTDQVLVESATRDGVALKVNLARPVVIGYAMIKTDPWPDPPDTAADAGNYKAASDKGEIRQ